MLKVELRNVAALFKELSVGDVYLDDDNDVMMRIENVEDNEEGVIVNCVNLATGEAFYQSDTEPIRPVSARLIVGE